MSNADEILKLKELLDEGIITQEEFNKKKSELLSIDEKSTSNIPKNSEEVKSNIEIELPKIGKTNEFISWIFFTLFVFAALGSLGSGFSFATLLIYIIMALICCPPVIEKVQVITKIRITTAMRVIAIFVCLMISSYTMTLNYTPKNSIDTKQTDAPSTKQEQIKGDSNLSLSGTSGKNLFNKLCSRANITPRRNSTQIGDYIMYAEANMSYAIYVDSSLKDEIMDFEITHYYDDGEIDKEFFLIPTELNYEGSNKEKLTNWINNNIGNNAEIKIGSLTFTLEKSDENYIYLYARTDKYEETYLKK